MRILLAEDEKLLSDALVELLKHNNYSVDAVYDGEDAAAYLMTGDYDIAILDPVEVSTSLTFSAE